MQEVKVKTHLIISDIHEEYDIKWIGKFKDVQPALNEDGLPLFIIISDDSRVELNTMSMKDIEECAKRIAHPKGRSAVTTAISRIYLRDINGSDKYMGSVIHRRVKQYQQMFDTVGYR